MADIEKVIKAFECCDAYYNKHDLTGHERCPYNGINGGDGCNKLYVDALELLKEYKRQDECPCTHCQEYACEAVCNEYEKWHKSYME